MPSCPSGVGDRSSHLREPLVTCWAAQGAQRRLGLGHVVSVSAWSSEDHLEQAFPSLGEIRSSWVVCEMCSEFIRPSGGGSQHRNAYSSSRLTGSRAVEFDNYELAAPEMGKGRWKTPAAGPAQPGGNQCLGALGFPTHWAGSARMLQQDWPLPLHCSPKLVHFSKPLS